MGAMGGAPPLPVPVAGSGPGNTLGKRLVRLEWASLKVDYWLDYELDYW